MKDSEEGPVPADDFEVEANALHSESAGAAPAAVQSGFAQRLWRKARSRRLLFGTSATLVALLVLASVPSLRGQALRLLSGPASPMPQSFSFSSPPQPTPGPGWSLAGPHNAFWIAFAPSEPTTAYTCGPQHPSEDRPVLLSMGVSHDSGHTWQTLSTPATGAHCDLTIDPTNALDVVLRASSCQPCTSPQVSKLYRTFDGGVQAGRK